MRSSFDIVAGFSRVNRTRFHFWLAVTLFVPLTALTISTYVLDSAVIPGFAVFTAFPLVLLLQVLTIVKLNAALKVTGTGIRSVGDLIPSWVSIIFLMFWVSAISGIFGSFDAAKERDGKYVVNDHGVEREVTKAEAIKGNRAELRSTSSVFGALSALGLAVAIGIRNKSRSDATSLYLGLEKFHGAD